MKAYSIFGDVQKSIELNLNRFDDVTKMSFIDLFKKVSAIEFTEIEDIEDEETVASYIKFERKKI